MEDIVSRRRLILLRSSVFSPSKRAGFPLVLSSQMKTRQVEINQVIGSIIGSGVVILKIGMSSFDTFGCILLRQARRGVATWLLSWQDSRWTVLSVTPGQWRQSLEGIFPILASRSLVGNSACIILKLKDFCSIERPNNLEDW